MQTRATSVHELWQTYCLQWICVLNLYGACPNALKQEMSFIFISQKRGENYSKRIKGCWAWKNARLSDKIYVAEHRHKIGIVPLLKATCFYIDSVCHQYHQVSGCCTHSIITFSCRISNYNEMLQCMRGGKTGNWYAVGFSSPRPLAMAFVLTDCSGSSGVFLGWCIHRFSPAACSCGTVSWRDLMQG